MANPGASQPFCRATRRHPDLAPFRSPAGPDAGVVAGWPGSELLLAQDCGDAVAQRRELGGGGFLLVPVGPGQVQLVEPVAEDDIRPARGGGRHRREFRAALLGEGARCGVRTRVRSTGWGLPVSDPDPAGWS